MKLQPFRLRSTAILLAGLVLVSVTIAPAMAAGAINGDVSSARPATSAPLSITHGAFHHLHKIPAMILGWKWWHYLAVAVGIIVVATVAPMIVSNWASFVASLVPDTVSTAASSVVL